MNQRFAKSVDAYTAAFNRGDHEAMAASWSENGVWIHADGSRTEGFAAIREVLLVRPSRQGDFLRSLNLKSEWSGLPSVAIEEGTARLTIDGNVVGEERYEAVHVATSTGWKLSSLRTASQSITSTETRISPNSLGWSATGSTNRLKPESSHASNGVAIKHFFWLITSQPNSAAGARVTRGAASDRLGSGSRRHPFLDVRLRCASWVKERGSPEMELGWCEVTSR
jgi:hypothetical protein